LIRFLGKTPAKKKSRRSIQQAESEGYRREHPQSSQKNYFGSGDSFSSPIPPYLVMRNQAHKALFVKGERKMNNTENQNEQNHLADLEPIADVQGGPAANTYTGTTTIAGGTLTVDSSSGDSFYGTGVYKSVDSGRTWA
jgi:hypothetical protein